MEINDLIVGGAGAAIAFATVFIYNTAKAHRVRRRLSRLIQPAPHVVRSRRCKK